MGSDEKWEQFRERDREWDNPRVPLFNTDAVSSNAIQLNSSILKDKDTVNNCPLKDKDL